MIEAIYINGELSYCYNYEDFKGFEKLQKIDQVINHFKSNETAYKTLVIACAFVLINNFSVYANTDKFNLLENKMFDVGRKIARVGCGAGFFKDSLKAMMSGEDAKGVGRCVTKYSMFYGSVFLILWIFDAIEDTLG